MWVAERMLIWQILLPNAAFARNGRRGDCSRSCMTTLCRLAVVVVQQSTEALATLDFTICSAHVVVGRNDLVVQSLMIPFGVDNESSILEQPCEVSFHQKRSCGSSIQILSKA